MNVLISCDMEGCSGVVHVDQTRPNGQDYPRFRKVMTAEANAAALGAMEAGAKHVVITDAHGDGRNIMIEDLDPQVELISGMSPRRSMMEGIDRSIDLIMFVGYHAGMGTTAGVLDHTYAGACVQGMSLNGSVLNEAIINALLAGHYGVPVGLIAGDEATCVQTSAVLKGIETVAVKWSLARYTARLIHPQEACARIRRAAAKAARDRKKFKPYRVKPPYRLEVRLTNAGMADHCELIPGVRRVDGSTVGIASKNVPDLFTAMLCILEAAAGSIPQVRPK